MTTMKWIEIVWVVYVPLLALIVNGLDYVFRARASRGSILYLSQNKLRDYAKVHWLLIISLVLLFTQLFTTVTQAAFQVGLASWVLYINAHAIIKRRQICANQPIQPAGDTRTADFGEGRS